MILYRREHTDSVNAYATEYFRIKIFTRAGKKWGNVEIPFVKGRDHVGNIRARTIRTDGTIVPFTGKVYEKEIVKAGGIKVFEKTFSMPDVQPGCIIEYKYKVQRDSDYYWDLSWSIQQGLFTRDADFSITPPVGADAPRLYSRTFGMPDVVHPKEQKNGNYAVQLHDIPALVDEPYMMPKGMLRGRVEFLFKSPYDKPLTTAEYWKQQDKTFDSTLRNFINKKKDLQAVVAQTVSPSDSPETKLRKLYTRAQAIRNLTYEDLTSQEWKREKIKKNNNVADVLKHNYGNVREINEFFIGLLRNAGFQANQVLIAPRNEHFFMPNLQDSSELDDDLVRVKLASGDLFLDPAAKYYPFGLLPWFETEADGLLVNKAGGKFIRTPAPKSSDAEVERRASLQLAPDGSLSGTVEVDLTGIRAAEARQEEHSADAAGRINDMRKEVKNWLPGSAKFQITKISGWNGSGPLVISGTLTIPEYATRAANRLLVPLTPFSSPVSTAFEAPTRVNAVYFPFPYQQHDDIFVKLPPGFTVESLPQQPPAVTQGAIQYRIQPAAHGDTFEVKRSLDIEGFYYDVSLYPALRNVFGVVRTGDDEDAVLEPAASAGKN